MTLTTVGIVQSENMTDTLAEAVQPAASVTVTEYVPDTVVLNVFVFAPVFQIYVVPPEAVKVVELPVHKEACPVILADT